ncbi:MAG: hypothetical protein F6K19_00630 [Cyanothece sp. SIO1E1]|nr:hypothetical protein [Cyanothece sp. SIO1E1]
MKSLIRWGTTLGIVSGAVLGSLLTGFLPAWALSDEEIVEKLSSVPVFTITDENGAPLVASSPEGEDKSSVTGVFISREDAENFLSRIGGQDPELVNNVQIIPVSLGEVYKLAQANSAREDGLEFAYVPMQTQVESALSILQQEGEEVSRFNGVPLFLARAGEEGGYLTIQQGENQVIPLFFKQEELQSLLDRFKESQPEVANVTIQVVNLEGVIDTLQQSTNPQLDQVLLIPPSESLEYVRSLRDGEGEN